MLPFHPMRTALILLLVASPAVAQKEEIFGTGKPPNFREEKMDSRFVKSKFAKMLVAGTEDPGCVQLLGGLFLALGEIAPLIHRRDENFTLPPEIQEAIQTQLSTPRFPAIVRTCRPVPSGRLYMVKYCRASTSTFGYVNSPNACS